MNFYALNTILSLMLTALPWEIFNEAFELDHDDFPYLTDDQWEQLHTMAQLDRTTPYAVVGYLIQRRYQEYIVSGRVTREGNITGTVKGGAARVV